MLVQHCVREKKDQNIFCNVFYKTQKLWMFIAHVLPLRC